MAMAGYLNLPSLTEDNYSTGYKNFHYYGPCPSLEQFQMFRDGRRYGLLSLFTAGDVLFTTTNEVEGMIMFSYPASPDFVKELFPEGTTITPFDKKHTSDIRDMIHMICGEFGIY